jgi:hypothetical protein
MTKKKQMSMCKERIWVVLVLDLLFRFEKKIRPG